MLSSKLVGIYPKTENRDNFPTIIKEACDDDERARTKNLLSRNLNLLPIDIAQDKLNIGAEFSSFRHLFKLRKNLEKSRKSERFHHLKMSRGTHARALI